MKSVLFRVLSIFRFLVMIGTRSCHEFDELDQLRKLDNKLTAITRQVNSRNIDNFVFHNKLTKLQEKIGDYQDEDRRLIMQINGLPYIPDNRLYQVLEEVAKILNISISDEEISMLLMMGQPTDEVFRRTGKKVYPILLGLKTRKIKWKWMGALRHYIMTYKEDYKQYGLTINFRLGWGDKTISGVTVHEHLSPQKRKLFKKVKKMCTEMDFQDMWFNDSQIYVKKRAFNQPFMVRNEEEMYQKITRPHWSRDRVLQLRHNIHHQNHDE